MSLSQIEKMWKKLKFLFCSRLSQWLCQRGKERVWISSQKRGFWPEKISIFPENWKFWLCIYAFFGSSHPWRRSGRDPGLFSTLLIQDFLKLYPLTSSVHYSLPICFHISSPRSFLLDGRLTRHWRLTRLLTTTPDSPPPTTNDDKRWIEGQTVAVGVAGQWA